MVLADFNHDGKLDFATSGNLLALGNGDGTFQTPVPIVASVPLGGFYCIAAADINNDGWPDLVLCSFSDPLFVLLNNQQGGFNQVSTNFGQETSQAILADLMAMEIWTWSSRVSLAGVSACTSVMVRVGSAINWDYPIPSASRGQ